MPRSPFADFCDHRDEAAAGREVAQRGVGNNETSNSMLSLIDVASETLEELLGNSDTSVSTSTSLLELEMLM